MYAWLLYTCLPVCIILCVRVCVCVWEVGGVGVCDAIRITVGLLCGFKAYFGHIHSTNHPLKPVEEVTFVQHDVQHIEICRQRACGS